MGMVDIAVIAAVVAMVAVGARRAIGAATGRRDCCSGDLKTSAAPARTRRVADTDESHYPYATDLSISGMSCERCAHRVEGALNAIDGVWARVDLGGRTAHVLSKTPLDLGACRKAVAEAGYRMV